jgi:hypothetical protein
MYLHFRRLAHPRFKTLSFVQFLNDGDIVQEIDQYWSDFCASSFPQSGVLSPASCQLFKVHALLKGNYLVLIQEHWEESIQLLGEVFGEVSSPAKKFLRQHALKHKANAAPKIKDSVNEAVSNKH